MWLSRETVGLITERFCRNDYHFSSEFLNHHLLRYFASKEDKDRHRIQFSRSRPYEKDDNAHVEQKNWTHVRQLFGYYRLDNPKLVSLINDLYKIKLVYLITFFYQVLPIVLKTLNKFTFMHKYLKKYIFLIKDKYWFFG